MTDKEQEIQFEDVVFPKRNLASADAKAKRYKVYKTSTEFLIIDASSALEAVRRSGILNPDKVETYNESQEQMLPEEKLTQVEESKDLADAKILLNLGIDVSGLIETDDETTFPEA